MKKIISVLLLLCLCLPGTGRGEDALPVLRLEAALLDYVAVRPGTLTAEDITTPVTVKYRGSYSVTFAGKRNYSLHLKDEAGEQRKRSLLGLREDDDYVLLGGLSDLSRLRCPVGLALWRGLGYPAPDAAACELYFGEYYKGIYYLVERPDRKSAGVPRDGALYRVLAASVDGADLLSADAPGAPEGDAWHNVGLVYPETAAGWQPLQALLAAEDPSALLDLTAFADYYLFVNLIGASDNLKKNLYLCWDGSRFYPMPWDLDAAFGRLYNASLSDPAAWYTSPFFTRLRALPGFDALLARRWQALRQALCPDAVMALFQGEYDRLEAAGAWQRELERFPAYEDSSTGIRYPLDPAAELLLIRGFLNQRYALLEAAFSPSEEEAK